MRLMREALARLAHISHDQEKQTWVTTLKLSEKLTTRLLSEKTNSRRVFVTAHDFFESWVLYTT
jgi:hypothetical protein